MSHNLGEATVCVVGLGYVGLPLAEAFAKRLKVIGFDIDGDKIAKLRRDKVNRNLIFTGNAKDIARADFIMVCVPTPVTSSKQPDLSYVRNAAEIVGQNIKKGSVVILESTVYPGVTEEIVKPILEETSGLKCGKDFRLGYSPERINPGDEEHTIDKVTKVVAGMDEETADLIAELYLVATPYVYKANNIKTAEAAKVIENVQRDLNIALMNELAIIFEKMGLSTKDVLDAAATKWNFHRYHPGLVGGHCIPVDPYYLVYKAEEIGYHPQVILAGRAINDSMGKHIAEMTIKALNNAGKVIRDSKVLIMGLAYKENTQDTRESRVKEIIKELEEYSVIVLGYDPLVDNASDIFQIEVIKRLGDTSKIDCVILTQSHKVFKEITLSRLKNIMNENPILIDIKGAFSKEHAERQGFNYYTL